MLADKKRQRYGVDNRIFQSAQIVSLISGDLSWRRLDQIEKHGRSYDRRCRDIAQPVRRLKHRRDVQRWRLPRHPTLERLSLRQREAEN
jgi:hypothetical protein